MQHATAHARVDEIHVKRAIQERDPLGRCGEGDLVERFKGVRMRAWKVTFFLLFYRSSFSLVILSCAFGGCCLPACLNMASRRPSSDVPAVSSGAEHCVRRPPRTAFSASRVQESSTFQQVNEHVTDVMARWIGATC